MVARLHVLWDSRTSTGTLTLLLGMEVGLNLLSFGLACGAAGSTSILSAAGTGQNQLAAEAGGTELVPVPGTVAVPAVWTVI